MVFKFILRFAKVDEKLFKSWHSVQKTCLPVKQLWRVQANRRILRNENNESVHVHFDKILPRVIF